ncbi:hypothetical protein EVAR_87401_1 [Eumeta japonica]|uniref:Uncharacterized protein n=1 Tax=Eumeta variegata TaxID=151549 RepID=A0A4C1TAF8_EUMVA|nr:hypothetical protein EVAR_87401_1 [Eumeta japonica]
MCTKVKQLLLDYHKLVFVSCVGIQPPWRAHPPRPIAFIPRGLVNKIQRGIGESFPALLFIASAHRRREPSADGPYRWSSQCMWKMTLHHLVLCDSLIVVMPLDVVPNTAGLNVTLQQQPVLHDIKTPKRLSKLGCPDNTL